MAIAIVILVTIYLLATLNDLLGFRSKAKGLEKKKKSLAESIRSKPTDKHVRVGARFKDIDFQKSHEYSQNILKNYKALSLTKLENKIHPLKWPLIIHFIRTIK